MRVYRSQGEQRPLSPGALTIAVVFGIALLRAGGNAQDQTIDLQPVKAFSLTGSISSHHWSAASVREMRLDNDGIWFLIERAEGGAIVKTNPSGAVLSFIDLPGTHPVGLSVVPGGVATIVVRQRKGTLTVYNSTGQINSETALPCFGATGLLTFEGKPSTVCADGSITEFGAASGSARYSSWAKPGTLVEPLPNGKLVIVDRSTAQVVVNDVHQNTVSAFSPQAPEINGAIQQMNSNLQAVAQAVPHVPVGRPIVAFDTASDSSGWYMLIWPYNKAIGPTVLKFDSSGNVTARLRCRVPRPELGLNLHWLKAQNGYLVLASGFGNVLVYALPNT